MQTDTEDETLKAIRTKVRARLKFYRDLATYVVVVSGLFLIDWLTGGDWWVQWVAGIWGGFLLLDALETFVVHNFWGRDTEERMVERELRRHHGA